MNMVEKVARAIDDAACKHTGEKSMFNIASEDEIEFINALAHAAIEAMREPNEGMIEAGAWETSSGKIIGSNGANNCYRSMIDAALKE